MHNLQQRSSHSAPYKPHGVRTWEHFFGSKLKITKRCKVFDPKKGGGSFFRHFLTPPPPPPLSEAPKSGSQVGGGGSGPKTHGGVRTKNSLGMHLLAKIMILQEVKLTIQPLGVGYANRPKKAQNGGVCGVFPYMRLPGFDLTTSAR